MMKFGILTEACVVGQGTSSIPERYREVLAEGLMAEKVGFDVIGSSEQHFNAPLCTISAGELILSALAAVTERIRLRTSITLLPFQHPVRVAEQIATLDILSNGRAEFGSGRGNSTKTAGGLGIDLSETSDRWKEGMDIVIKAWTQEEFSYDGRFYKIPPRQLSPRPVQKPHPALWYAAISPQSHELAGQKGMGVLSLTVGVTLQQLEKRIALYRKTIRNAEPYAGLVNDNFSVFVLANCADTTEKARADARSPMLAYLEGVVDLYEATMRATGQNLDFSETRRTITDFEKLDATDNIIVGDPDTVVKKLKRYEALGINEVMLRMEGMKHQDTLRAIELFGKHVIPEFRK